MSGTVGRFPGTAMSNATAVPQAETGKPSNKPSRWLRIYLIVIAVIAALGGLVQIPALLSGGPATVDPDQYVWAGRAWLGLTSPFGLIALFFLIRGDYRRAIPFIAGIGLLKWIWMLPAFMTHELAFPGLSFLFVDAVFQMLIWPMLAVVVFILCWKNERLTLAGFLAGLPPAMEALGMALFAIAVMIYGF
jgi:hypothetical protein